MAKKMDEATMRQSAGGANAVSGKGPTEVATDKTKARIEHRTIGRGGNRTPPGVDNLFLRSDALYLNRSQPIDLGAIA